MRYEVYQFCEADNAGVGGRGGICEQQIAQRFILGVLPPEVFFVGRWITARLVLAAQS